MQMSSKKAFTMVELIFVIVVIGILAGIAIPKFAATRDDATITKAIATVGSVRSAVATERQKRILRGDFDAIYKLSSSTTAGAAIFDGFDGNTSNSVLEYPLLSCNPSTAKGCWRQTATGSVPGDTSEYTYNMPVSGTAVFELKDNRFNCKSSSDANCLLLTK